MSIAPAKLVVGPLLKFPILSCDTPRGPLSQRTGNFCRVYWGSHGCRHERGHDPEIPHECDCCECGNHPDPPSIAADADLPYCTCVAKPPYYGPDTKFYGEEAETLGLPGHDDD